MLALTAEGNEQSMSRGAHGSISLLWEKEGKKNNNNNKKKPRSEPSPLAIGAKGEKVKRPVIFSQPDYTSLGMKAPICTPQAGPESRQDLADVAKSLYFLDQPSKDPESLICSGRV